MVSLKNQAKVFLENVVRTTPQYIFWKDTNSTYLGSSNYYAKRFDIYFAFYISNPVVYLSKYLPSDPSKFFIQTPYGIIIKKAVPAEPPQFKIMNFASVANSKLFFMLFYGKYPED